MNTLLKNAKIVCKDKVVAGSLIVENGKIASVGNAPARAKEDAVIDCRGLYVLPGFFESHFHGIAHFDFYGGADPVTHEHTGSYDDAIARIMEYLPRIGVTSALLSSYTVEREKMEVFFREARKYRDAPHPGHARLRGLDSEGNFLKDPLFAGAQDPDKVFEPDIDLFEEWQELSGGGIVKALIAPEWGESAFTLIRHMAKKGLYPSVGHTGCTRDQLLKAHDCGTRVVVHTGNGPMSQNFKTGGALDGIFELGSRLYGEVICDFCHVHPHWINTFIKCFSQKRTLAISDAGHTTCAGLKEGDEVGGCLVKNGALWIKNKVNTLAGSVTPLSGGFRNMINLFTSDRKAYFQERNDTPYSLDEALPRLSRLYSLNAAELMKLDKETGSIAKGKSADLIVAEIKGSPGRYGFSIRKVFVAGVEAVS